VSIVVRYDGDNFASRSIVWVSVTIHSLAPVRMSEEGSPRLFVVMSARG
jgi:hypothetical protein